MGITDYRIVYSIHNLNGMSGSSGDGVCSVVVEDSEVTECTVELEPFGGPGDCFFMLSADPYPAPVSFLFARLASWDPAFTTVVFHSELPLPVRIDYDDPATADEEYEIRVIEFEAAGG